MPDVERTAIKTPISDESDEEGNESDDNLPHFHAAQAPITSRKSAVKRARVTGEGSVPGRSAKRGRMEDSPMTGGGSPRRSSRKRITPRAPDEGVPTPSATRRKGKARAK